LKPLPDLRAWLTRHKLTQGDLALICGVTERCVGYWLSGRSAAPQTLRLLMRAVDDDRIDLPWLAGVIGEEKRTAA